jgi:hypothetical protein
VASQVLIHTDVQELPAGLVLKHWTIHARSGSGVEVPASETLGTPDAGALHAVLYTACMELVSLGHTSRQAFEVALGHVSKAKVAITSMTIVTPDVVACDGKVEFEGQEDRVDESCGLADAQAPPRVRSRGRPRQSRFKSPIESPGAASKKSSTISGVATSSKKRVAIDENGMDDEGQTRRRCKLCGEFGHYRSTCGRKSTYKAHGC